MSRNNASDRAIIGKQALQREFSRRIRRLLDNMGLSSNSLLLAARDEFEFAYYQLHRRVSRADVIPSSLLQGEFIADTFLDKTALITGKAHYELLRAPYLPERLH